jgi:hypothetical protein
MYPLLTVPTESEAKWNERARNHIFEALDEGLFDRVFALETTHEVWMQLKEIHVGNKRSVRRNMSCSRWNSMSSK